MTTARGAGPRFGERRAGLLLAIVLASLTCGCRGDAGEPRWRRDDVARTRRTLEHVTRLSEAARARLAATDEHSATAESLLAVGEAAAADRLLGEQLDARRRWLDHDDPLVARSLVARARARLAMGDVPAAIAFDREALAIRRRALGPRHPEIAESADRLAVDLKTAGGSREEPLRLYREALALRTSLLGADSPEAIETLLHLGNLHRVRREPDSALAILGRVASLSREPGRIGEDALADARFSMAMTVTPLGRWNDADLWLREAIEHWRHVGHAARPSLARALGARGLTLRHLGRWAEAEAALLESVTLFEQLRREAPPGWMRPTTVPLVSYELLAAAQLELGRGDEAWRSLERGLGRSLLENLAGAAGRDTSGWWDGALARVQRSLAPDEAVIGWLAIRPGAANEEYPFWCYCVRTRGPVTWCRVEAPPGAAGSGADVPLDQLRRELVRGARWPLRVRASAELDRLARDAYELRVAPLEPALHGVRRLVVVSVDLLHGAPLECMLDSASVPLGERFVVSYAPSALLYAESELQRAREQTPREWTALLVGDPVAASTAATGAVLAGGRREVRDLAARLPSPTVLLGVEANAARLRQLARTNALGRYRLMHFATHAVAESTWRGESALLLASGLPGGGDGRITDREIWTTWKLDADLVTLAGCETALGAASKEGFLGLEQALLGAGARHLLVSAWHVDDEATGRLMGAFYQRLLAQPPGSVRAREAEALAEARRWLRAWRAPDGSTPYANPVYWAGFVLVDGGFSGRATRPAPKPR